MNDPFAGLREALRGRYVFGDEVGRGGMSVVFRARDLRSARDVAVKVLLPELSTTVARDRFLREVSLEMALDHPHVVRVLDSGEADDLVYLVLPLIEGPSLRDRLAREGPLPLEDALSIVGEVAEALGHAHERGVIHRDVKPGNILLSPDGAVVTDFGVARAVNAVAGATLTDSALAIGTPTYMAPEQAGESKRVDERADIYALACVLFEMLAGEPPFQGKTPQAVAARHMLEKVPTLSVVRPGVPRSVELAIEKALAKVPADRFASMEDFVAALTRPVPQEPGRQRWPRVAGGVALAGLIAGLAWWTLAPAGPPLRNTAVVVFPLTEVGVEGTPGVVGETVALAIVSALEATDPLVTEDGFTWLSPEQRGNIRLLPAEGAERIARDRRARYWVDGEVVRRADSAYVTLRLHDLVTGDVTRRTDVAAAGTNGSVQGGLRATVALLPTLLEEGRRYDLPGLLDRDPSGVALWMLGNRAYRASDFSGALDLYRRALDADDRLARAALRAAPAASWVGNLDEAAHMVELALGRREELPPRFVDFGEGLHDYLAGSADSAVTRLNAALAADSTWEDAWMALGEVYRHLLPRGGGGVSAALDAFRAARRGHVDFSPPLYHIAELTAWREDFEASRQAIAALRDAGATKTDILTVTWIEHCIEDGMTADEWTRAATQDVAAAMEAASSLAASKEHLGCARLGFEALLGVPDLDNRIPFGRYNAVLALHGLWIAGGVADSATALLARGIEEVSPFLAGLWVVDAAAGLPTEAEALQFISSQWGDPAHLDYEARSDAGLWLLTQWEAHRSDAGRLTRIAMELKRRAADGGPEIAVWAAAAGAQAQLARGDSVGAITALAGLRPVGSRTTLPWSLWDDLAAERMTEATLLLSLGRPDEAIAVASEVDSPASIVSLIQLRRSLELRVAAAEASRDPAGAAEFRARLLQLSRALSARDGAG